MEDWLPFDPGDSFNRFLRDGGSGDAPRTEVGTPAGDSTGTSLTVWRVRRAHEEAGDAEERGADAQAPDEYLLRRVLAVGGFGEVWEATQLSLGRPIAVKRLRPDLLEGMEPDDPGLRRLELAFRQEALTAASLEHPNILPVHDLGFDEDGHLLMAMKLVRGRPWDEILAEDRSALSPAEHIAKHLPVLMDVCNAVAFAHSRGVVHRDLKPSQVMVGEFGEVLLMDWGIAMLWEDAEVEARAAGPYGSLGPTCLTASNPAGTVAYMAPEQTVETTDGIGPWTDIYLLGGILYELLTLRRPHSAPDRKAAFLQARLGEVADIREAAAGRPMPDELVAAAMRALSPRPEDRFARVEDFHATLRDYITGAGRRREAEAIATQTILRLKENPRDYTELGECLDQAERALALWPESTAARKLREDLLLRYAREALHRRDLHLARVNAERLPRGAERDGLLAAIEGAEEEQRRADERLFEALGSAKASRLRAEELVTFLLEDLHGSLKEVNRLDLLEKVSRQAIEYFEHTSEAELGAEARRMRSVACRNIGDVFRGRGDLAKAADSYERFRRYSSALADEHPADPAFRADLADACDRLGVVAYYQGRLEESKRWHEESLALLEALVDEHPGDPAFEDKLAHAWHQLGVVAWRSRDLDAAQALQEKSLAVFRRLAAAHPGRSDFRVNLGWNLGTFGNVMRDRGRLDDAIAATQESVAVRDALRAEDPENLVRVDDLCWSVTNLALLTEYTGRYRDSLAVYQRALELRRRLVEGDPSNAQHTNMLGFILSSIGRVTLGLMDYERAAEVLGEAEALSARLAEQDQTNARDIGGHALTAGYYGQVLLELGRDAEARALVAKTLPQARHALSIMPANGVFQNAVIQSLILRGRLAAADGDADAARRDWAEALEIVEPAKWRTDTAQGMGIIGELLVLLGRPGDAAEVWAEMRGRRWMMPRYEAMESAG